MRLPQRAPFTPTDLVYISFSFLFFFFQEVEEVYSDLCVTLSDSVLQGAEMISVRVSYNNFKGNPERLHTGARLWRSWQNMRHNFYAKKLCDEPFCLSQTHFSVTKTMQLAVLSRILSPHSFMLGVVQLVRNSSIMRVVVSSSPDWSENFIIFHITYDSCSVIIGVWLSGSEPTIIRMSAETA